MDNITANHGDNLKQIKNKFHLKSSHSMDIMRCHQSEVEKKNNENRQKNDEKNFPKFVKLVS